MNAKGENKCYACDKELPNEIHGACEDCVKFYRCDQCGKVTTNVEREEYVRRGLIKR